jgi:hypothetical protein
MFSKMSKQKTNDIILLFFFLKNRELRLYIINIFFSLKERRLKESKLKIDFYIFFILI